MTAHDKYQNPNAFRISLEQRLRTEAEKTNVPLDRLRKEAAFNRLLRRMKHAAPNVWALKGGFALIARIGSHVRGTKDIDANWRATQAEFETALSKIETMQTEDWFTFVIGNARSLRGEGELGALRYSITVLLDGRTFDQLTLDINVICADDPRPIELVQIQRNPFSFIGESPLDIPMVTPAQQLAEKLHAYTRVYEDGHSNRAKDLFDMLVIAEQVVLPTLPVLRRTTQQTFEIRSTAWPHQIMEPPEDWESLWKAFMDGYLLSWTNLDEAFAALQKFWLPVLSPATIDATWDRDKWQWA